MIIWLYHLKSDSDYHNIIDFLKKFSEVYGVAYYFVDGVVKLKSGDLFGVQGGYNLLLRFSTDFLEIDKKITEGDKVNLNSLIKLSGLDSSEVDKSLDRECYIRKGVSFIGEKELLNHLKELDFKFSDNSILTEYDYVLGY